MLGVRSTTDPATRGQQRNEAPCVGREQAGSMALR
jgi:hypothetical protein